MEQQDGKLGALDGRERDDLHMDRVSNPAPQVRWLIDSVGNEEIAGYDVTGWESSIWVLHAMYENRDLAPWGTWKELQARRAAGDRTPLVVDGIDLESGTDSAGNEVGVVRRPGPAWQRISWEGFMQQGPGKGRDCGFPPCFRWFGRFDWPIAVDAPLEGSLDEESLRALIEVLGQHSAGGESSRCYAHFGPLSTGDFDVPHLWHGPLKSLPNLIHDFGGPYWDSPSNFWAEDRSWFVWTDYDLWGTKVSGSYPLIRNLQRHRALETVAWP